MGIQTGRLLEVFRRVKVAALAERPDSLCKDRFEGSGIGRLSQTKDRDEKTQLSEELVRLGDKYYHFVNWTSGRSGKNRPGTPELTFYLSEEDIKIEGTTSKNKSILRVEGVRRNPPNYLYEESFYLPLQGMSKDLNSVTPFIKERLEGWFGKQPIQNKLMEFFLDVPISNAVQIIGDPPNLRIGVPLQQRDIAANSNSTLSVKFESQVGQCHAEATLNLQVLPDRIRWKDWYEKTQCRSVEFYFCGHYQAWQGDISSALNRAKGPVKVLMTKYERCRTDTDCWAVTTPK